MPGQSDLLRSPFSLREGNVVLRPFTRRNLNSSDYLRWMNDPRVTRTIGRFDYLLPVSKAKLEAYFNNIDTDTTMFLAIYVVFFNKTNSATAAANMKTLTRGKGDFVQVAVASQLPTALEEITKKLPLQLYK